MIGRWHLCGLVEWPKEKEPWCSFFILYQYDRARDLGLAGSHCFERGLVSIRFMSHVEPDGRVIRRLRLNVDNGPEVIATMGRMHPEVGTLQLFFRDIVAQIFRGDTLNNADTINTRQTLLKRQHFAEALPHFQVHAAL